MRLSASLAIELWLGMCYCVSGAQAAACNSDNCLRAIFPTGNPTRLAAAQSFCSTYTMGVMTATTGFPSAYTAGCGSAPSRYSSACSCGQPASTTMTTSTTTTTSTSTTTTTPSCAPTPSVALQNGGFECGLYPWRVLVTEGTTYALTSPGEEGAYALEIDQNAPLDGVGLGEATASQLFYLTAGVTYTLNFQSYWSIGSGGFIGVKLNGQPVYTVDAEDHAGPGVWNSNTVTFTGSGQLLLEFEWLFGSSSAVSKIDNVSLTPPK